MLRLVRSECYSSWCESWGGVEWSGVGQVLLAVCDTSLFRAPLYVSRFYFIRCNCAFLLLVLGVPMYMESKRFAPIELVQAYMQATQTKARQCIYLFLVVR